MTGKAPQSFFLYVCSIILPFLCLRNQLVLDRSLRKVGLFLVISVLVCPTFNLIHFLSPPIDLQSIRSFSGLFKTEFTSAIGVSGLLMLAIAGSFSASSPDLGHEPIRARKMFLYFLYGAVIGGTVLWFFCLVQMLTGYHFAKIAAYRVDRMLPNGFFRVTGYGTHPILFAGASLAMFSFFWSYLWNSTKDLMDKKALWILVWLCFVLFSATLASGSRGASLIAVCLSLGVIMWSKMFSLKKRLTFSCLVLLLCAGLVLGSGLHYRIEEIFTASIVGGLGERKYFWQAYWELIQQAPLLGHGPFWLDEGVREAAYVQSDLAHLPRKYQAHNIYLEILASCGLVGFMILVGLGWGAFRTLKSVKVFAVSSPVLSAAHVAFGSVLLFGLIQNTLFDTPVMLCLVGVYWMAFWVTYVDRACGSS